MRKRILIVEDNADRAAHYSRTLAQKYPKHEVECIVVRTKEEARNKLRERARFDSIVIYGSECQGLSGICHLDE
ncbi:MAG: hypothetical protein RLZZ342_591 [Candidatus Parcubacteria bacterium]|jgi:DNA-binding NtrC family response regulator